MYDPVFILTDFMCQTTKVCWLPLFLIALISLPLFEHIFGPAH